jgi:hypothetical protein
LVAIRISYLLASHGGFRLNPRSLELLDAVVNIGLDKTSLTNALPFAYFHELAAILRLRIATPPSLSSVEYQALVGAASCTNG